jgi:hypothetical protein
MATTAMTAEDAAAGRPMATRAMTADDKVAT